LTKGDVSWAAAENASANDWVADSSSKSATPRTKRSTAYLIANPFQREAADAEAISQCAQSGRLQSSFHDLGCQVTRRNPTTTAAPARTGSALR
jgi:hypothetical protein